MEPARNGVAVIQRPRRPDGSGKRENARTVAGRCAISGSLVRLACRSSQPGAATRLDSDLRQPPQRRSQGRPARICQRLCGMERARSAGVSRLRRQRAGMESLGGRWTRRQGHCDCRARARRTAHPRCQYSSPGTISRDRLCRGSRSATHRASRDRVASSMHRCPR